MTDSPFPFQGPLPPELVTGREELAADLARRLTERRLTAVLGPRRYGKTSLLRRVTKDLSDVGPEAVWVDLYECQSMEDVASAFDRGIATSPARVRTVFDSIGASMSLRIGFLGFELSRPKSERPDAGAVLRLLVRAIVEAARRQPLLLVLDEFSGLAGVKGAAGVLRTGLQHHYRDLGIVFAGSQPSTMTMLFTDHAQPFFAQADLVEIGPLSDRSIVDIVQEGFERTGRDAGIVTAPIVALAEGHPQRAMQLADAAWQRTEEGGSVDAETWEQALVDVRTAVDGGSERLFERLPAGHQRTLRVVANGGSIYGTAANVLGLSTGTASGAVRALKASGYLVDRDGALRVVDPLFGDWMRRRFPI